MTENWKRWMIQTGTVLGVYIALRYLLPMTVPFLLGWLLAVLILPAVRFLERRLHVKRSLGGMFLIFLLAAGMGFLLYNLGSILLGQAGSFLEYLGIWKKQAGEILDRCCGMAEDLLGIQAEEARDFLLYEIGQFQEQLQNKARPAFFHYLFSTVKGAVALVSGAVIAVVVGILLVREMEELEEKVRNNPFLYRVQAVGRQICRAGGRYLKAQVIIMAVVAALCMAGFWLLGDPWFSSSGTGSRTSGCSSLYRDGNGTDSMGNYPAAAGQLLRCAGAFSPLCGNGSGKRIAGTPADRRVSGNSSDPDAAFCLSGIFLLRNFRVPAGAAHGDSGKRDLAGVGTDLMET